MKMAAYYVVFKSPHNEEGVVDYVSGPYFDYFDAMEAVPKGKEHYIEDYHHLVVVTSGYTEVIEE